MSGTFHHKKGLLFKVSSVNRKSVEDARNFHNASGVITRFREVELEVWDHLSEAKNAFPGIKMVEMGTLDL